MRFFNNNFKVAITSDTTILEYYQSIYIHCKQRFNIQDRIEIFKKLLYQYIENCINNNLFRNYNLLEVRNNLYNNLLHYLQLETEDLNSKTLNQKTATTENRKRKFELAIQLTTHQKQLLNTYKHLNKEPQKSITTSTNLLNYLQKNESNYSENLKSEKTESEQEETTKNKEKITTAYIAKISKFTRKDNDTGFQEWLNKIQKTEDANK
ncbi:hypothetical protein G9A89_010283 [Geosiphon pyriformis]|nr:hypothetical protein G9A89_010283 [Geosiphon pyriformis]